MKKIAVYGATGSVGSQALDIVRLSPDQLEVELMSCHSQIAELARAANEFQPRFLVVSSDTADLTSLERLLTYNPEAIFSGSDAAVYSVSRLGADVALNAMPGIAGLPLLAATLEAGLPTALANKESIVSGAEVIKKLWQDTRTPIYPVDSEHAAIYQCLGNSFDARQAAMIWLTGSGGPFLHATERQMAKATVSQAMCHPNWSMGPKITIDSATLANKGLEIIEAHFLFSLPPEQIRVVIQPTSRVHSMVTFKDATTLAQMGIPDMRLPLERALLGPDAAVVKTVPLDFWSIGSLSFSRPDFDRFPCLDLAYEALKRRATAVYSAADEAAVSLFLKERISLTDIPGRIGRALERFSGPAPKTIDEILELDGAVRSYVLDDA